jgi:hypothetical protein
MAAFLKGYPRIHTFQRGSGKPIHLIAINTDSDVHPSNIYRLFAIGHFQSQLVAAKALLSKLGDGIRVLLLHHSWHKRGVFLKISRASRGALNQFLDDERISILLSGHVHTHLIDKIPVGVPSRGEPQRYAWECRCGTTTQIDKMSYGARSLLGQFPQRKWPANSLLVHRITQNPLGGVEWDVQAYVRDRTGFNPFPTGGHRVIDIP